MPATALVLERLKIQEQLDRAQEQRNKRYEQFLKFRRALLITYPRVAGDTPVHTVVKMILQKHDRLVEFDVTFCKLGYEERLAFFQKEFETLEALLKCDVNFAAQNNEGKTIFHELCADWYGKDMQRDLLYRKLVQLIFTSQTQASIYLQHGRADVLAEQPDIVAMIERLQEALELRDNTQTSVLDVVCQNRKPCDHEGFWCVTSLLLGTTVTFKSHLLNFLQHYLKVRNYPDDERTIKCVLGLWEEIKNKNDIAENKE